MQASGIAVLNQLLSDATNAAYHGAPDALACQLRQAQATLAR